MRSWVMGLLGVLMLSGVAFGGSWTSPDGNLGIDLPDDGLFVEVKPAPAPAVGMWVSGDGKRKVVVVSQANPQNIPVERAGFEEGTVKAMPGGQVESSRERMVNGVPVYTVAVVGNGAHVQQCAMTFNGVVYKVMAAGPIVVDADPKLVGVFSSIRVLATGPIVVPSGGGGRKGMSNHEMSVFIAEMGIYAFVGAAVLAVVLRKKKGGGVK